MSSTTTTATTMPSSTSTLTKSTAGQAITSANELLSAHCALISRVRQAQQAHRRQLHTLASPPIDLLRLPFLPEPSRTPPSPQDSDSPPASPHFHHLPPRPTPHRPDLPPAKRARVARYSTYVPEEETIRNDYSQRYVDGGEWPQNWVLGAEPERRFEEYPKQQRLLNLKKASVNNSSLPSTYLPFSSLSTLHPCKFDVILLDPPFSSTFSWQTLQNLPIPALAADPSFVFLWVGSGAGDGLERGRELLAGWGYRRCEDVVWCKTNKTRNLGPGTDPPTTSVLTRTKQHCLIGIRGTVRRSTDSWFVHCNVDTDVLIWEGDPTDPTRKPPETYTLIENFCLGTRRLEIFGKARSSLRRGWVTVLHSDSDDAIPSTESALWDRETWEAGIKELAALAGGKCVVPMTPDIDALRPKSPFRPGARPGPGGPGVAFAGSVNPAFNPAAIVQPGQMQPGVGAGMGMGMGMQGMVPGMGMGMGMGVGQGEGGWPMNMPMGVGGMGMPMGMNMGMMGMPMQMHMPTPMQHPQMGMGMPQGMQNQGMQNMGMGGMGMPYGHFQNPGMWMDQGQGQGGGWDASGMMGGMMGPWGAGNAGGAGFEGGY